MAFLFHHNQRSRGARSMQLEKPKARFVTRKEARAEPRTAVLVRAQVPLFSFGGGGMVHVVSRQFLFWGAGRLKHLRCYDEVPFGFLVGVGWQIKSIIQDFRLNMDLFSFRDAGSGKTWLFLKREWKSNPWNFQHFDVLIILDACHPKNAWCSSLPLALRIPSHPQLRRESTRFSRGQFCRRSRKLTSLQGEIDW